MVFGVTWEDDKVLSGLELAANERRLGCTEARLLLHGCVRIEHEEDAWVRPWRYSERQVRAFGSCRAWHPGLFRQMARASAGIRIAARTDASEVMIELRIDNEPPGTRAVLQSVAAWRSEHGDLASGSDMQNDALSVTVDERVDAHPLPDRGQRLLRIPLDDPSKRPRPDVVQLPCLGPHHEWCLWLPALRGCSVRRIWYNGTYLQPVHEESQLLVLGDSIAQGFVAGDSAHAWPSLLAHRLGCGLLNQGLGGQVFQSGTLIDLDSMMRPQGVVVAFGANYRYERCSERAVEAEVHAYLAEVARHWPEIPIWVLTPTWHDEQRSASHPDSCWDNLPSMIATHASAHGAMHLIDGAMLLDPDPELLADGIEHPNACGASQIADRLYVAMRSAISGVDERLLRARALDAMAHDPSAFVVREAVRRRRAKVLFAEDGCVLATVSDGEQLLWAPDFELAVATIATLIAPDLIDLHTPKLADLLCQHHALDHVEHYHVALFEGTTPPPVDTARTVRVLDTSYLATILEHYTHPEWLCEDQVRELLASGCFLGGFEGDELVGFIGEHQVGAMGLLEVFAGHRRKGWAAVLEAHQIARTLERGDVPWAQVYPNNRASLRLQQSLGLRVVPASEQCFLSRSESSSGLNATMPNRKGAHQERAGV